MNLLIHWILLFSSYSFLGWLCESIYCSVPEKRWINRGFLTGPFCPVYGFGALLVLIALTPLLGLFVLPVELIVLFFAGAILASALEYLTSVLLEKLFHTSWWDYSNHKYQIHGRVCLINSVLFGLLSVVVLKVVHPVVSMFLLGLSPSVSSLFAGGFLVFFCLDGTVTTIGLLRLNGKLCQLQLVLDEIRQHTAAMAESNRMELESSWDELLGKANELKSETISGFRQALEGLRLKSGGRRAEELERLWQSFRSIANDESRLRLRILKNRQEYLETESHPIHRRLMNAFPKMRSIQNPESLQRLRQAADTARELAKQRMKKK